MKQLACGPYHTCALLEYQGYSAVKCWGENWAGQLGQGDTMTRGDDPGEMGDFLPELQFGVCTWFPCFTAFMISLFFNGIALQLGPHPLQG